MSSLPNAPFDSDAARQLRKLKRGFVLDLYLRRGCFWQSISDMRTEWAVTPTTSLPPLALSEACPENWPDPADFSREALELNNRWWFAIDEIRDLVVPAPYNDWQYFGPLWRGLFQSALSTILRKQSSSHLQPAEAPDLTRRSLQSPPASP